MKFTFTSMLLAALLALIVCISAMPVPTVETPQNAMTKRDDGPVLPLPAPGETLLAFLDRLLANLPLLGKLLEGLGYIRPK
ncbi:hypothetical protein EV175_005799 [Coemansia sp. RSA 1933]|nr:hypothetical protein EV175_005799 [Coemansia sp. RSA 1933]